MDKKYKTGDLLEVTIEKIVPNGFGLAFAENLTVFVPLSVKSDKLLVKINQLKGKSAFAEIVEVKDPSPDRIDPVCQYFGKCGGCNFQQMPYEKQLEAKIGILQDCLTRIGKINYQDKIEIIPSPEPFGYRSRAQWHFDIRNRKIGYFERNSHSVIDIESCPILNPLLEKTLVDLKANFDWQGNYPEIVDMEAAVADGNVSTYSDEIFEPTNEIAFNLNGKELHYNASIFFQGNPLLIDKLIEAAIAGVSGKNAIDLYCGVGLFTLQLSDLFESVSGVEDYPPAVDYAEKNVELAGINNVEFARESVIDFLQYGEKKFGNVDFILLDPPRSGTEKGTIEKILEIKPRNISYVSCEPSILARDLQMLVSGGYSISSITALDLFPQTHHIETVVRLTSITEHD